MKTATETTVQHGFGPLPCPKCGAEATVSIDLDNLTAADVCKCNECDEEFGLADVRAWMARWQKVLAWIDLAPALEPTEA